MKLAENDFRVKLDPKTIEAVWRDHLLGCPRCTHVDLERPVTLRNACPEGVQYVKVIFAKRAEPELAKKRKAEREQQKKMRGEFFASKKDIAAAMRYK